MRKSTIWGLAMTTFVVSGAVAASALAPAVTRAEEGEVTEVVNYILDPDSGAYVYDLQTISITFPDNKNIQVNEKMDVGSIVLTAENGKEYYCDSPVRDARAAEGTSFLLYFLTPGENEDDAASVKPITELGNYDLTIPQGSFVYGEEVEAEDGTVSLENVTPVQTIRASYTVIEAPAQIAYVLDPEDGALVNDLQTIVLSFPDNANVMANERMESTSIVLRNIESGDEYYCEAPDRDARAAQGSVFTLRFMTPSAAEGAESEFLPINIPGSYELDIVKGAFMAGNEVEAADSTLSVENIVPVEAIHARYTVVEAAPAVKYTLDPENGAYVNDLQSIRISFENKNVQLNERMELDAIVLTAENGDEYYCDAPVRDSRAAEGVAYTLYFLTSVETESGIEEVLKPITAPGQYKLSIVKGTFVYGNEVEQDSTVVVEDPVAVEAINATYHVVEAAPAIKYVLDPADEAVVYDLQTISISFPDNKNVYVNERMELNSIVLTNVDTEEEYYCDAPVRDPRAVQGIAYTLKFMTLSEAEGAEAVQKPITKPGSYRLSILKNTFITADEVEAPDSTVSIENIVPVEAIYATYTVVAPDPEINYVLDPEDGAIVNDLQKIELIFPDNRNIQYNVNAFDAIVLTNTETLAEYYCDAPDMNTREQGMAFDLYFRTAIVTENGVEYELQPITEPGTYTLSIRKGAFLCGDEVEDAEGHISFENITPVQAINATYTVVVPDPEFAYVLNPEDGATVEDLQTIVINFPDTKKIQYNFMEFNSIVLTNTETGAEYYCDGPDRVARAQSGISYKLTFLTPEDSEYGVEYIPNPITEPGTYRLFIRKGAFLYADEVEGEEGVNQENYVPVQEIVATYVISGTTGVNGIFGADATEFNVYGVNGVQILKSADRNAVNALPAGLYIINGKKVIKR